MGVAGVCLLCSSHKGFAVDVLGSFPNSLKSEMGECYVNSSDSMCWLLFILNKILRIPEMGCEKLLSPLPPQNNFRICGSCAQLVNQDVFYRQQILKFKSEVDDLENRVRITMAQCPDEADRSSKIFQCADSFDVEAVISKVLKALDSSLSRSGTEMDDSAKNNSKESLTGGDTEEISNAMEEDASSSPHDYIAERDNRSHRSHDDDDDTCNKLFAGKSKKSDKIPERTQLDLEFPDEQEEWPLGNYLSQPNPSVGGDQTEIQEIPKPIKSNESTDNLQTRPVQSQKSTTNNSKPRENRHNCHICDKVFVSSYALKRHIMGSHTQGKSNSCSICHKTFSTASKVKLHMVVHTGVKPFQCQLCSRTFARKNNLSDHHMRKHATEMVFKCHICLKTFPHPNNLRTHIRNVHNRIKPFTCQICSKSFFSFFQLSSHMRVHTNEKPYKCVMCDKSFSNSSNLGCHLRVHHIQEKPFCCKYCRKEYGEHGSLKYHMARCLSRKT